MDIAKRLPLVHAANFLAPGLFLPFFPAWLAGRGFGPDAIAAVLALATGLRILASSHLSGLADRRLSPAAVLVFSHVGVAAAALGFLTGDAAIIVAAVALYALGSASVIPVTDAVTLAAVRADPSRSYARLRLSGSVAFALANVAGGALLLRAASAGFETIALPLMLAGCAALGALAAFGLRAEAEPAAGTGPAPLAREGFRLATPLGLAIAAAALIQASHALLYGFSTIDWMARGIDSRSVGALWAVGVAAEVALFASVGRLGGARRAALWLAIGAAGATLRWLILATAPPGWALYPLQLLHGLSFGATHLGTVAALGAFADPARRAFWQGRAAAMGAGAFALATLAAGPLHRSLGEAGHVAMAALSAAGLVLAVRLLLRLRKAVAPTPPSGRKWRAGRGLTRPALAPERDAAAGSRRPRGGGDVGS